MAEGQEQLRLALSQVLDLLQEALLDEEDVLRADGEAIADLAGAADRDPRCALHAVGEGMRIGLPEGAVPAMGRQGQQLRREALQDGQAVGVHPPAPGTAGEPLRPSLAQMEEMRRGRHGRSLCKVIVTPE